MPERILPSSCFCAACSFERLAVSTDRACSCLEIVFLATLIVLISWVSDSFERWSTCICVTRSLIDLAASRYSTTF